ncbi:MAG: caspase family protein, partial [Bacteroidota bacterium]
MHSSKLTLVLACWGILASTLLSGQKPELVIPLGHAQAIQSFDFSSTGEYLLTGAEDGFVKLWKTATGQELKYYCGPKGYQVSEAILTPNDQKVIIGADDGAVFIFETFTGQALFTFSKDDLGKVNAIAVAPDGTKVWSAHESTVVYWDIETGQELFRAELHQDEINDLAIAPDGQTGISVGDDQNVIFWDLNTGEAKHKTSDHAAEVIWSTFINKGQMAVSAAKNNSIIYWNPATGSQLKRVQIPGNNTLVEVAMTDDNQNLLTRNYLSNPSSSLQREVNLWSITADGLELRRTYDGGQTDPALAFSPDQQMLVTGSGTTGVAQLWYINEDKKPVQYKSYAQGIHTTYLTKTKLIAVSHDIFGNIKVFDLNQNKDITLFLEENNSFIKSSAISKDKSLLIVNQSGSSEAPLFDLNTLQPLEPFKSTVGEIGSLDMSQDKDLVATATNETAYLWNLQTGKLIRKFVGHEHEIEQVAISSNQRFLLTTGSATCRLWNLQTGELLSENIIPTAKFPSYFKYAFSSNGKLLAVSDGSKTVLWDLIGLKQTITIPSETVGGSSTLSFSENSSQLYIGEWNGNIQVYSTRDGKKEQSLAGYGNQVNNIETSSNGNYILSTSDDQTLTIKRLGLSFLDPSGVEVNEVAQVVGLGAKDWAIVTPKGLFDASPGAMELMYFIAPNTSGYEVIELEQLKSRYRDPGLLQKILGKVDEPIRNVDGLREVALHPEVTGKIVNDELQLQLRERSGKTGRISVFVNEREVARDLSPTAQRNGSLSKITFDLKPHNDLLWANPARQNIVSVEVTNQEGWLSSKRLQLNYPKTRKARGIGAEGSAWTGTEDPTLYIISVGTADYTDTILDLRYAEQDAAAMSKALYTTGNQLFEIANGVEAYCLTTKKDEDLLANTTIQWAFPSKENIRKTFLQVQEKAKAEDVVVVYFAGHGLTFGQNDKVQFYYLTQAFANEELIEVADTRQKFAISSEELTKWLKNIPALKQVLIIDACNSGNVVENIMAGRRNINSSQIRAIDRMQ